MKLKFYLIGFGMGALLATAIMIISGGLNKAEMTDDEIMARARQLGMVESSSRLVDSNTQGISNVAGTDSSIDQANASDVQNSGTGMSSDTDASAEESSAVSSATEETGASQASTIDTADQANTQDTVQDPNRGTGIVGEESQTQGTAQSAAANSSKTESSAEADASTGSNQTGGQVIVTVPDGLFSEGVSELLEQAGAIDDATAFNTFLIQSGRDRYISPGAKLIPGGATYEEVATILSGR